MKINFQRLNPRNIIFYAGMKGRLRFLKDESYLRIMYKNKFGHDLDLENPSAFNEKLQWLKLNNRHSQYTTWVDKYEVKEYIAGEIGEKYIIPSYGIWDDFRDIDFNKLPDRFILKCTHDSGGVFICEDKASCDLRKAEIILKNSLKRNYYWVGREWPYKNVKPRILAEKYIQDESTPTEIGLRDYKFYCFHGEPIYIAISEGMKNKTSALMSFLTMDWKRAPFNREGYIPYKELPEKPEKLDEMIEIAKVLSKGQTF